MHSHLLLIALVAPLVLSLPQPMPRGESTALVARHKPSNFTRGGEGRHHKEKHHSPPGSHHPERALIEEQSTDNSTGRGESRHHAGMKHAGQNPRKHHPERHLVQKQDPGNFTRGGEHGTHDLKSKTHHGGPPPRSEHDLTDRHESGNSTSGGLPHSKGEHHHEGTHPVPELDERIRDGNGTTGSSDNNMREKFRPIGYNGGPLKHGEHARSIVDTTLERRQENATVSGKRRKGKHGGKKGHLEHHGSEW